jgi:hypothetical protein
MTRVSTIWLEKVMGNTAATVVSTQQLKIPEMKLTIMK